MFDKMPDWRAMINRLFGQHVPDIRPMTRADLDEVLRIIRLHDSDDYKAASISFERSGFDQHPEVGGHFVIMHPTEPRPVGVSGYYIDDLEARGLYWLGWTYVNPFCRGQGYGGKLIKVVFEILKDVGARKLYLSTSSLPNYAAAVGFYKKHGFVEEGRLIDFYDDGDSQIIMGRRIAPLKKASYQERVQQKESMHTPLRHDRSKKKPADDDAGDSNEEVIFEF